MAYQKSRQNTTIIQIIYHFVVIIRKTGDNVILTIEVFKIITESKGYKCLSDEYTNFYSKLKWDYNEGYLGSISSR